MLTNPFETQLVQSLGVRIGPGTSEGVSGGGAELEVPVPRDDACHGRSARGCARRRADRGSLDVRRRSAAREHSRIRPPDGADRHREIRQRAGGPGSGREDPRRRPRLLRHVGRHRDERSASREARASPTTELVRPALRRLLEPHLPLQPRLRALLSRRRRHAPGRHGELRRPERAGHRRVLQGHRRNRRFRARMRDDPDGRRAASAARHPRDRPARGGAWTVGRRRHQRREHHGEPGEAPGGGRGPRTVPFPRCARS